MIESRLKMEAANITPVVYQATGRMRPSVTNRQVVERCVVYINKTAVIDQRCITFFFLFFFKYSQDSSISVQSLLSMEVLIHTFIQTDQ